MNTEHPEGAAHGEHLPEGVAQQSGDVPQAIHERSGLARESPVVVVEILQDEYWLSLPILDLLQ